MAYLIFEEGSFSKKSDYDKKNHFMKKIIFKLTSSLNY